MTDIATHVRIFDPDPSDDLVAKRTEATKSLAALYGKSRPVAEILHDANDLAAAVEAKGIASQVMAQQVETAVREAGATAFVAANEDLQVKVCTLLAVAQLLGDAPAGTGDVTSVAVLAVGLWSALAFQSALTEPKLEGLRKQVMSLAHQYVMETATSSRSRANVPDVAAAAAAPFDAPSVANSINSAVGKALRALRTNAAIDREELDLLWWVLSGRSNILDRRFSGVTTPITAALASGIEAGLMLRRLPADAHRHLVLRHVKDGSVMSLTEVVTALGDDRAALAKAIPKHELVSGCPAVFPLLGAVISGSAARAKQKRAISEWAARALLETAAIQVTCPLPAVNT